MSDIIKVGSGRRTDNPPFSSWAPIFVLAADDVDFR